MAYVPKIHIKLFIDCGSFIKDLSTVSKVVFKSENKLGNFLKILAKPTIDSLTK